MKIIRVFVLLEIYFYYFLCPEQKFHNAHDARASEEAKSAA